MNTAWHKQLIELLQKDGRRSSQKLAREIGVSHSTVQRTIRKLVGEGRLRIAAVVDPARVGFPIEVVALLSVDQSRLDWVMAELVRSPNVNSVSHVAGRFDILAFMRFSSFDKLSQFFRQELANIAGIKNSETLICLDTRKGRYALLKHTILETPYRKLIGLLQDDGRRNSEVLATELKVSPSTVQRTIHKLISDGVLRISALVDADKAGLKVSAVICVDVEQNKWDQVVEGLAKQPAVRYVSKTAGSSDVLAFTRFRGNAELTEFLEKVVAKMVGVRNSETFVVLDFQYGSMYADWT